MIDIDKEMKIMHFWLLVVTILIIALIIEDWDVIMRFIG